ncbi:MAG TPA: DUF4139 domain-containing protein [Propionibacteriaceae bacterium]|nr:DUF4139 domain-containing protein [Propionibacteriaceae bacterium]
MTHVLPAPVVSVTVYPGQARVTRRGRIQLPAGTAEPVVVDDLPLSVVHESVRVTGRGVGAITGVDVRTSHHPSDETQRVAELLAQRQRLAVSAQEIVDRRRVLDVRIAMLESVASSAGRPYAKQLATAALSPDDLGPVSERLAGQLADVLGAKRGLLDEEKALSDQQAKVDRELGEAGGSSPDRTAVVVSVEPGEGGELELEVSYLVDGATWEPRYDIRLDETEVDVTWFGMVQQWSGEDWPECELRLSTARPTGAIQVPDLNPWYLTERVVAVRSAAPQAMAYGAAPTGAMMDADMSMARMKAAPMEMLEAQVEEGITAMTYVIQRPVAVPSDGSNHQARITSFRLPARVDHVTAPVRSDDVYLRATVTNRSEHTLRTGRASLFHGTEFVGVSDIDIVAPGEEVELALGLDDRIRVKRELVARTTDKAFIGGTARHEARWRTTVANHSGKAATITVIDQVPVSKSPQITVKDVKVVPDAKVDDVGEVTWQLDLADGAQAELSLAVKVEVAKGTVMIGWRE